MKVLLTLRKTFMAQKLMIRLNNRNGEKLQTLNCRLSNNIKALSI